MFKQAVKWLRAQFCRFLSQQLCPKREEAEAASFDSLCAEQSLMEMQYSNSDFGALCIE